MAKPDSGTDADLFVAAGNGRGPVDPPGPRSAPQLVSVIVPVLNEERYLGAQLAALARQTYGGAWELVVVDNGCTDRSLEVLEEWRAALPEVVVVDASARRGLNWARNAGASAARGEFLAFCDADDVVETGWLEALVDVARTGDIVGGSLEHHSLNDASLLAWRPTERISGFAVYHDFLPSVPGGNCGVWATVAQRLGWDPGYAFGGSDIEFSWRAQVAGYQVVHAPEAVVSVRFRRRLDQHAWQWFRYGAAGPRLFRRFRDEGMEREDLREALTDWRWSVAHLHDLLGSSERRGYWVRNAAWRLGRLAGSLRYRVLFL
jgi:glycosyltransferase involved in cell wall biosynthesis